MSMVADGLRGRGRGREATEGQLVLYTLPRNPYDPPCSVVPLSFGKEKLSGHIELANLTLTLPTAKAGDSQFDDTCPHRRSYSVSLSVPSCEEVPVCPRYLSASWASHDVPGGPSGSPGTQRVARDPWSLIMVAVLRGSLPPTTDNSDLPKSQPDGTRDQHRTSGC